jgi:hypothetical protein
MIPLDDARDSKLPVGRFQASPSQQEIHVDHSGAMPLQSDFRRLSPVAVVAPHPRASPGASVHAKIDVAVGGLLLVLGVLALVIRRRIRIRSRRCGNALLHLGGRVAGAHIGPKHARPLALRCDRALHSRKRHSVPSPEPTSACRTAGHFGVCPLPPISASAKATGRQSIACR